jgi:hypothetical protein
MKANKREDLLFTLFVSAGAEGEEFVFFTN